MHATLTGDLRSIPSTLRLIEKIGVKVDVIFLQAQPSDLLRRYSDTDSHTKTMTQTPLNVQTPSD